MKLSSASCWLFVSLIATGCKASDDANEPTDSSSGDSDGDGYTVEDGDCDDENDAIHPNAVEACDGLDTVYTLGSTEILYDPFPLYE